MQKLIIKYLSSVTGSGKTHSLLTTIKYGSRAIIATPRKEIGRETKAKLEAAGFTVKLITGKDGKTDDVDSYSDCGKAFRDAIKADNHEVIIVDHSVALKKLEGVDNYDLYIDEVPQIDKTISLKSSIPMIQELMLTLFPDTIISDSHLFYEMTYTKEIADLIATFDDDEVMIPSPKLREMIYALKSDDHTVVIRGSSLKAYKEALNTDPEAVKGMKLRFQVITKPSILSNYKSVTMISAGFETSEPYYAWRKQVDFIENDEMISSLRPLPDHKKGLVQILYLSDEMDTWADYKKLGYQDFLDRVATAFHEASPNTPHIYCVKKAKDDEGNPTTPYTWLHDESGLGKRTDPSAKGINGLSHYNVAIHLTPINPATFVYNFKREFYEMQSQDVKWAVSYAAQYQFASRTSYRDYESTKHVAIIVLDFNSAMALHEQFGEASAGAPIFFDIGMEELRCEKKQAMTANERLQKSRIKKKMKTNEIESQYQYENFLIRQWSSVNCTQPLTNMPMSWSDFVMVLQKYSKGLELKSKSACPQLREGYFIDPDNHKLVNNIQTSKLMQMDIDKATVDPAELSLFLTKNNVSHVIANSYSSQPLDPRFHLFIPLSRAVCGDDYAKIFKLISADIIQKFDGAFEIDASFKSINKKISMPCVSGYKGDLFINGTVWKDMMTYTVSFLDVERYLNRVQIGFSNPTTETPSELKQIGKDAVEDILTKWAVAPGLGKGGRHFYNAGVDLKKAGCSYGEIIQILSTNRHMFGHGQDRNALDVTNHIFKRSTNVSSANDNAQSFYRCTNSK
ncbi:hypothetical protein [Agrobacterium rosae]|uniref:Uncharacterized protein n=1 Tax=Agrobacterium rosae TaxID=1972867 RepID=A0AAE5RTK9_9HYPH|nr:hypothetical protein [Agrobacterium rosae]KAA3511596.1 hypothetical protein DXM21_14215 [Agrobacterium rosae]KAA3518980.1 hypothetical protein DXM25_13800 [Agrobacterium rosae]MQB49292.1 hypothetical protein [Agrobacterium rosae]POO49134.1 hypothetical protein CPJ18_22040 [Agrobacterium rosae]